MRQNNVPADHGALRQFAERFRDDTAFHELVRNNTSAALAAVGIRVPSGVQVSYAPDAASAISMALDRAAPHAAPGGILDDSLLLEVVGGTGQRASPEEIRQFVDLLKHYSA